MVSFKTKLMKLLEPNWKELSLEEMQFIQNLHPVFDTELDTYKNVSTPPYVTGHITLWDALQKIKYNLIKDINPKMYLTPKYVDNVKNTVYDELKEELPAICYNASFNRYKNLKNTKAIHNLMFLDIDNFSTKQEALSYKAEIVKKYDWILACSLSLSKIGLHIIVMVDKITDHDDFNIKYDLISNNYFEGSLDPDSKGLHRFTIVPYDHDIYINNNPVVLPIDTILQKSLSSAYIEDSGVSHRNHSKSLGSAGEGEVIYTTQTISVSQEINKTLLTSAQQNGLVFKPVVDENYFEDPNTPLFFPAGIEVIEINLFLYKHQSIPDGRRTRFIGAMTTQMIFLNVVSKEKPIPDVRESILRYIMSVNNKFCSPSLSYNEVLKSYNSNWKRYRNGEMDFTAYYKLKRSLWSQNCTLTGNQKRGKTMTNIHGYKRLNNLYRLENVIQQMADKREVITQDKTLMKIELLGIEDLGIYSIKTLWKFLKPSIMAYKKDKNVKIKIDTTNTEFQLLVEKFDISKISDVDDDVLDLGKEIIEKQKNLYNQNTESKSKEDFVLSDDQKNLIFNRVFSNIIPRLNQEKKKQLLSLYQSEIQSYETKDQQILLKDFNEVSMNDYWRHGDLETQLLNLLKQINI